MTSNASCPVKRIGLGWVLIFGLLQLAACTQPASDLPAETAAEERTNAEVNVVMTTALGEIELAIYPDSAPISAGNFLAYIEEGHYGGATLYRSAHREGNSTIAVIQGGLLGPSMAGDGSEYANPTPPRAPIAHETTHTTGISNEQGTIAYARMNPGSATSEFFFNMENNAVLDTDNGGPNRDGHGYATFGRVVRGFDVLQAIHGLPRDGSTGIETLRGQIITEPVPIKSIQILD